MLNFFLQSEEERTKGVIQLQGLLRSPYLDPFARLFTSLSDEAFIIAIFPFLLWGPFCDGTLAWHLCLTIGITFTVGNMLKNLTCKRRPLSPPAWADYTSTEEFEFALPSTHALNSMAMSLVFACHCLFTYGHVGSPLLMLFWVIFPLIWSGLISVSRVYLGAHSIPDIVGGLILGFFLGLIAFCTSEFIRINGNFITMLIGLSFVVIVMLYHPVDRSNALYFHLSEGTFDYTPTLLGVAFGSISGRYFIPNPAWMCTDGISLKLLLRYLIFGPFVALVYVGVRHFAPVVLEILFKKIGIEGHYIPYTKYKEYILHAVRTNGNSTPNSSTNSSPKSPRKPTLAPSGSISETLSSIISSPKTISAPIVENSISVPMNGISEKNENTNGHMTNEQSNGHTSNGHVSNGHVSNGNHLAISTNPKLLLCYTRLWGKLILYSFITWTVSVLVPLIFYYTGF